MYRQDKKEGKGIMSKKTKSTISSYPIKASMCVMGTGQIMQKQWIKGMIYLSCFIAYIVYMVFVGVTDIKGFFTLGTVKSDAWLGIKGDDSIMMMLKGILAFIITAFFIGLHKSNINDIRSSYKKLENGEKLPKYG